MGYRLSIIIPVYNVENYILDCLKSVFDQGLLQEEFEVIIINDGSTDNSLEICQKFSDNYTNIKIISQKNQGQSAARNRGLEVATGEYIYFIDSDDFLEAGYFKKFLDIAQQDNYDLLGFQMRRTSSRFQTNKSNDIEINSIYKTGLDLLADYNYNNGTCWYIIRKETIGHLSFKEGMYCEDGLFTAELLQNVKKAIVLNNRIYNYFINDNSTVKTVNVERSNKMINDMITAAFCFNDIILKLPEKSNQSTFNRLRERQESYLFFALIRMLKNKKSFKDFADVIKELNNGEYKIYPISNFKGYTKIDSILIGFFNNKLLLRLLIKTNQLFNFIKN